eukprot:4666985-Amphidinium_carterae.2
MLERASPIMKQCSRSWLYSLQEIVHEPSRCVPHLGDTLVTGFNSTVCRFEKELVELEQTCGYLASG